METSKLTHAIIVAGHAVCKASPSTPLAKLANDENWILQTFQKGEPPHYIAHIRTAVTLAANDPSALLIFSGGQTRPQSHISEAHGYLNVAHAHHFWGHNHVPDRVVTEEYARDSFDNLLFGIARFLECVGSLPLHVTLVSWGFKKDRFLFHAYSIRWPLEKFAFVNVGDPHQLDLAVRAEASTLHAFRRDATGYGTNGSGLGDKKHSRNPHGRQHTYCTSCPLMRQVLEYTGCERLPKRLVPW